MPRWGVATICDRSRLPMARVIASSLRRHNPDVPCLVLLADVPGDEPREDAYELLVAAELGIPGFAQMAFRCEREELSYALTPHLLRHLLGRGDLDAVLFLKQESLVVGDLGPVLAPLVDGGVVLTPHLLGPLHGADGVERERLVSCSGVFNGGVLGVARRDPGPAFLDWWAERIGDECVYDIPAGLHYEQRWLDLAPTLFDGVRILRDPAANVGHWSMREHAVTVDGDAVLVDGLPGRVVRFSGYEPEHPERVTRYAEHPTREEIGGAAAVLDTYREALLAAGHAAARSAPYEYDHFADGVTVPRIARELHRELGDEAQRFGDPFAVGPGTFREWLREPLGEGPPVTRLWDAVWHRRTDLQAAMPDHLGDDRKAFSAWPRTSGMAEYGVPGDF